MVLRFLFVGFLCAVSLLGCAPESNRNTLRTSDPSTVNDIGIAEFSTPDGWISSASNGNTAVALARDVADPGRDEVINVDIIDRPFPSAKQTADAFARKFSGTVSASPLQLDGQLAYRVSIPANYNELLPRECIVTHHDNKACLIIGGSKSKSDIWIALEEIAKTWKWK